MHVKLKLEGLRADLRFGFGLGSDLMMFRL